MRKGCDLMVLNDVGTGTSTFGGDLNEVTILTADTTTPGRGSGKSEIATRLVALLAERLAARQG